MRASQYLLPFLPVALAAPVNVDERDANLDKRVLVTESTVVWTTTTILSTQIVWAKPSSFADINAAGFEGDERHHEHTHHVGTPKHTKPTSSKYTPPAYTPPASTSAAPAPETSSSAPPPPPSTSSVYVAPEPTSTYVPPPPTSTYSPPPPPTTSSVYVAPSTSAAPALAASDSSSSSSGAAGTKGKPFKGEGTYYAVGMGSCGGKSTESEKVVAIGQGYMSKFNGANPNNNPKCGQEITISYKGVTQTAKAVDTCGGCLGDYDLDMSQILFECFASTDAGRIYDLEWWWN